MTHGECKWKTGSQAARARLELANFAAKFSARGSTDGRCFPQCHFPLCLVKNGGCRWLDLSPVVGMVTFPIRPQDQVQCICCWLHMANSGSQQPLTTSPLLRPREPRLHWKPTKDIGLEGFWQFRFGSEVALRSLIDLSIFIELLAPSLPQSFSFFLIDHRIYKKD